MHNDMDFLEMRETTVPLMHSHIPQTINNHNYNTQVPTSCSMVSGDTVCSNDEKIDQTLIPVFQSTSGNLSTICCNDSSWQNDNQ